MILEIIAATEASVLSASWIRRSRMRRQQMQGPPVLLEASVPIRPGQRQFIASRRQAPGQVNGLLDQGLKTSKVGFFQCGKHFEGFETRSGEAEAQFYVE
jgi:hypothetical protein